MYFSLIILAFLVCQATAFGLTIGTGVMDVSDILNIPESPVKSFCDANCTAPSVRIAACNNDPFCLCNADTGIPAPDIRAGSNAIMGAYGAACKLHAQVSLPPNLTSLSLPKSWDGPFVGTLPLGVAVLYAIFGGVLGFSALYILSNLE